MTAKERNERARKSADAKPAAFLEYAGGDGWPALSKALNAWDWRQQFHYHKQLSVSDASKADSAAKEANTPAGRAYFAVHILMLYDQGKQHLNNLSGQLGEALIAKLASLPISPNSKTGLTLLTKVVDAWQRQPVPPDKAHVRVVENATRQPYAASEASRRAWIPAADVTAINVEVPRHGPIL